MGLNIKKEETHALASQVAELAGETLTQAVTVALEERLERLRKRRDADAKIGRVKQIIAEMNLSGPAPDHGDLLYDEQGLPK
jgi:antitoxin VapB